MPETRCAAVVLAAGASTRLGKTKQLIRVGGETLLRRTARLALKAGCAPVTAVLGYEAERLRPEVEALGAAVAVNPQWREGMGASLRCGMEALCAREPRPDRVLLLVCDQPRLTVEHVRALLERHAGGGAAITASLYGGRPGVPAVFAEEVFPELLTSAGDRGAREVIRKDARRVQAVAWPDGEVDLDRPEDLGRLAQE
ncbi:MAG TPA: nucleotidyltransferase family protein [Acidobacteriaceae bacterium]|jgi:molybdenum cofactor cytidylyltransferase|nr:nucleotidyltransferase family protein [Acidobacteriaceae bacterium]